MSPWYKTLTILFAICSLWACQNEQNAKNITAETNTDDTPKRTIILEVFTEYPDEIDGCSCIFASDSLAYSQDKHICLNDFAQTAFVKIDGKLIRCEQISHENKDNFGTVSKYKAGNYRMTVTTKNSRDEGNESSIMTGSIKIEDNKGNTSEHPFYGICGC